MTPADAALPLQVAMMNEQMGIDGEGALPKRRARAQGAGAWVGGTCMHGFIAYSTY